jgi:hypothetical protein
MDRGYGHNQNPNTLATFRVAKGADEVIFMRENF